MYTDQELWSEIREAVFSGELSKRRACEIYGIHWKTLNRFLEHESPPGYRMANEREKPVLGPFLPVIHRILRRDARHKKSKRLTAKEIFERLQDEYGYTGGRTIVQNAVRRFWQNNDNGNSK